MSKNKLSKTPIFKAIMSAVIAMGMLAGCSSTGPNATPDKTAEPANENPVLKVLDTPSPEGIKFVINSGKVAEGTKIRVGVYGGGFEKKDPGCNGDEISGTDISVNGQGDELTGTINSPGAGIFRIVMTMPGYVTPCTGTETALTVKWSPKLTIDPQDHTTGEASVKTKIVKINEDFTISVGSDIVAREKFTGDFRVPMNISVRGPYATLPELQAAGCPSDAPIAATLKSNYQFIKLGQNNDVPPSLKVSAPGVYWFEVGTGDGEMVHKASVNSCAVDITKAVVIAE